MLRIGRGDIAGESATPTNYIFEKLNETELVGIEREEMG